VTEWFARPVLHVASVEAALRFYVGSLGFTVSWRFEDDGRVRVAQVEARIAPSSSLTSGRTRLAKV
jgi:catechol 2,3-dioxygenase-like lactoylglutathione lyase family enzyme